MNDTKIENVDPFEALVDRNLAIEKLRVATQVRKTHLGNNGRTDPETNELLKRLKGLEKYTEGRIAILLTSHPAYSWFSKVKGIGKENIAKVVGLIDINKAETISSLWKFAGYSVENGKTAKAVKGEKLSFNKTLKSMCWRLGGCLLKGKGKFYQYYLKEKEKYHQRFKDQGYKIVPAAELPTKDKKKYEPDGVISEGHIHNMAFRKMVKLFLGCLWLSWRWAENLPTRDPYALEKLGHTTLILPKEMTDR